jgi:formylmethanofuran dehydrogenase subunit E
MSRNNYQSLSDIASGIFERENSSFKKLIQSDQFIVATGEKNQCATDKVASETGTAAGRTNCDHVWVFHVQPVWHNP